MINLIKIVAPLSSIDNFETLRQSGADEFFCGFMPVEWIEKYGTVNPLNRREYMFTDASICSLNSMVILSKYMKYYGTKVKITLNSHFYFHEQYDFIVNYIEKLMSLGFDEFIVADICLLMILRKRNINCKVHLSSEIETLNHFSINFLDQFDIKRIIFPRKITLDDMNNCIKNCNVKGKEFEAFILNSLCKYSGGFCNSIHCDDLPATCSIPRSVKKYDENTTSYAEVIENMNHKIDKENLKNKIYHDSNVNRKHKFGIGGCGVCRIKELQNIGVTHLKVVGRGQDVEKLAFDVKTLREIIELSYETPDEMFSDMIRRSYLNNKCTKCYYPS